MKNTIKSIFEMSEIELMINFFVIVGLFLPGIYFSNSFNSHNIYEFLYYTILYSVPVIFINLISLISIYYSNIIKNDLLIKKKITLFLFSIYNLIVFYLFYIKILNILGFIIIFTLMLGIGLSTLYINYTKSNIADSKLIKFFSIVFLLFPEVFIMFGIVDFANNNYYYKTYILFLIAFYYPIIAFALLYRKMIKFFIWFSQNI